MKVLWIASGGPWILPMLNAVKVNCNIELLTPQEGLKTYSNDIVNGVITHHLPLPKGQGIREKMTQEVFSLYKEVIDKVKPDIIHVHGTEINFGQLQNFLKEIPVVVSIQGLLSGCLKHNTAFIKPKEVKPFMSLKNRLGQGGLYQADRVCEKGVKNYELDILTHCHYFFGRTNWDKARIEFHNPSAHYYKGNELLRPVFYEHKGSWACDRCDKHIIFMPSGFNPLKGMHIAVSAVALLRQYYPDVKLRIPGLPIEMLNRTGLKKFLIGEDFLRYVKHIISSNNIEENIEFLPQLSGVQMVEQMLKSNVYLSCSTIDNSSNAVGEATMLGMPIVVTAVGGLTSFMHDEINCLMAPSGDEFMIAHQIKRIFENQELGEKLAKQALKTAEERHNIEQTSQQYVDAYKEIIQIHQNR